MHNFTLDIQPNGQVNGYTLLKTVVFKKNGVPMNGLNPKLLNGNATIRGNSFDPEGLVPRGWWL